MLQEDIWRYGKVQPYRDVPLLEGHQFFTAMKPIFFFILSLHILRGSSTYRFTKPIHWP